MKLTRNKNWTTELWFLTTHWSFCCLMLNFKTPLFCNYEKKLVDTYLLLLFNLLLSPFKVSRELKTTKVITLWCVLLKVILNYYYQSPPKWNQINPSSYVFRRKKKIWIRAIKLKCSPWTADFPEVTYIFSRRKEVKQLLDRLDDKSQRSFLNARNSEKL